MTLRRGMPRKRIANNPIGPVHALALGLLAALPLLLAASAPPALVGQSLASAFSPADLAAACPAWTAPPAGASIAPPADDSPQAVAQYNAARVLQTPRPIRNLYGLTQRLVRHSDAPIPCVTRTTPRDERVGHVETFWATNYNQIGYHQLKAALVYATPHLYMYVADGARVDMDAMRSSADTFERQTYPTNRRYYGAPWWPGPDGDPHITILHVSRLCECGGYFSSADEYPPAVFPYSNERQMIYANLDGGAVPGQPYYDATLAHEFQHMIHWYWHPADPSWLNEGMSVLAQHANGYTSGGVERTFFARPDTMLGGWTDNPSANVAHYGAGYLFMDYFAEHYGGYPVLRELVADPAQYPLNIDRVLAAHGYRDRFADVFAHFAIANLLNTLSPGNGLYGYSTIPVGSATPQHVVSAYPYADDAGGVHQYAAQYYDLKPDGTGAKTLALDFRGAPYVGIVDNAPYNGAGAEWWGNSANYTDTTLTRAFDLGPLAGKRATLDFAAWYSLEHDYDYAYVEASADGGATWHTLKTSASTDTNPNGANYGNGITGISGGATPDTLCGPTPRWTRATADLSAYAGKQILLRFETISDDGVHCPGLALDDIRIHELGYADDASTDGGWQAQGFIRSNNVLPERYIVQAVLYRGGAPAEVRQIPVDAATGAAQASIADFGGSVSRVTLAVSAIAPATIIPAKFALSARLA